MVPASKFTRCLEGDGAHPDTFLVSRGVSGWLIVLDVRLLSWRVSVAIFGSYHIRFLLISSWFKVIIMKFMLDRTCNASPLNPIFV